MKHILTRLGNKVHRIEMMILTDCGLIIPESEQTRVQRPVDCKNCLLSKRSL